MAEKVTIEISPDGDNVRIEVNGVEGPECEALTRDLESAFGQVTRRERKPEYRRVSRTTRREVVR